MSYVDRSPHDPFFDDPALSDAETEGQHLCHLCKSITISGIRRVFTHHRNAHELRGSAEWCDSCRLLASTLRATPLLSLSLRREAETPPLRSSYRERLGRIAQRLGGDSRRDDTSIDDSYAVKIQDSRTRPEGASPNDANRHGLNQLWVTCGSLSEEFRMYATSVRTSKKWRIPRPMNSDSGSITALDLARVWDQTCLKKHKCDIKQSVLPTRVIDVNSENGLDPVLYVTKGEIGHWICLSHYWGTRPISTTTTANFEASRKGIRLGSLSKTFQDCIALTRELGIRYLWIDSLCIIQDSAEDWGREAVKMADVYAGAYLTIVAAAAKDAHEGFFMTRPSPEYLPPGFVFNNSGKLFKVFRGATVSRGDSPRARYGEREPNVVDQRAWCLQEEALSPRLLKYNRTHMSWHCASWADIHEDGRQTYYYDNWHRIPAAFAKPDHAKRREIWHMLLTNFTRRKMTFHTDKLPALAGVATEYHRATSDEYMAGIWMGHLPLGLLWRTGLRSPYDVDETPIYKRPRQYRAPSWSWASIDGPIEFSVCTSDIPLDPATSITLLVCSIVPKGSSSFSEVTAGSLSVRGKLKTAQLGDDIVPQPMRWGEDAYYKTEFLDASSRSEDAKVVGQCLFDLEDEKPAPGSKFWCLQLSQLRGLVLMPKGDERGVFCRIGLFRLTDHGAWFESCPAEDVVLV